MRCCLRENIKLRTWYLKRLSNKIKWLRAKVRQKVFLSIETKCPKEAPVESRVRSENYVFNRTVSVCDSLSLNREETSEFLRGNKPDQLLGCQLPLGRN